MLYNAYQMVLFPENANSVLIMRFFAENRKNFKVEKLINYDMEGVFLSFFVFESVLYRNGKAEIMPVVAGGLIVPV